MKLFEEKHSELERKAHALGQIQEYRVKQQKNNNFLQKIWSNKFKLIATIYFILTIIWRLFVSKKILKG